MSCVLPRQWPRSIREEVEARLRQDCIQTIECRTAAVAELASLACVGPAERAARVRWLIRRCASCGACVLGQ